MFIPKRLPTTYGSRLALPPTPIIILSDPALALEFASGTDGEADQMLPEGRVIQAERLSHLALEARCRATGERA